MAIGSVTQRGNVAVIYDEAGRQLSMIQVGFGPNDGLLGYTGSSVSLRFGAMILTYDARGRQISSRLA
jgi:hypothetical protein